MAGVPTRWIKLDVGFPTHPKARAAGRDGRSLHIAALCHCAQNLSDGLVKETSLSLICNIAEVKQGTVKALVDAGLWIEVDGGWQIHDYLDFQQSRASVEADREAAKERMRRRRSGSVRTNKDRSSDEVRQQDEDEDEDEDEENHSSCSDTQDRPDRQGGPSRLVEDALTLAAHSIAASRDINDPIRNRRTWELGYRTKALNERRSEIASWLARNPTGTPQALAVEVFNANPLYLPTAEAS